MTQWEPATDAEAAMRNALRTDDQESYFRILAGVDLLLPVSAEALAGREAMGWGTWSTGGRTHVLAFTSTAALQACLADYSGSARRVAYQELAETWPNLEWWLAVNPGLPVEGYLPAWFVAQLSRGDLRLPTRGPGREGSNGTNRIPDIHAAAAMAANAAAQNYADPGSGGPVPGVTSGAPIGRPSPAALPAPAAQRTPAGYDATPAGTGIPAGVGAPAANGAPTGAEGWGAPAATSPGFGPGGTTPPGFGPSSAMPPGFSPGSATPAGSGPSSTPPQGLGTGGATPSGFGTGNAAPSSFGSGAQSGAGGGAAGGYASPAAVDPGQSRGAGSMGPGGLPLRTPGAVLPSGLPSRVPATPPGMSGGAASGSSFSGFKPVNSGRTDGAAQLPGSPGAGTEPAALASSGAPAGFPGSTTTSPGSPGATTSAGSPGATTSAGFPGGSTPGGFPGNVGAPGGAGTFGGPAAPDASSDVGPTSPAFGSALDALASRTGATAPASGPSALDALGSRGNIGTRPGPGGGTADPASGAATPTSGAAAPTSGAGGLSARPGFAAERTMAPHLPPLQSTDGPLPVRKPMAQTPPVPSHIPTPVTGSGTTPSAANPISGAAPASSAFTDAGQTRPLEQIRRPAQDKPAEQSGGPGSALPRRQVTPPSERPPSMAAAAQALAARGEAGNSADAEAPIEVPPTAADPAVTSRLTLPGPTTQTSAPRLAGTTGAFPALGFGGAATTSAASGGRTALAASGGTTALAGSGGATGLAGGGASTALAGNGGATAFAGSGASTIAPPVIPGAGGASVAPQTATPPGMPGGAVPFGPGTGGGYGAGSTPQPTGFVPANDVERDLFQASLEHSTDSFLSTLLLATVLVPVAHNSRPGSGPGEFGFVVRTEVMDGERFLVVFTSKERISDHYATPTRTTPVRFLELIRHWPDPAWSFAVNPSTAVAAKYPGPQVIALASWATEAGLGEEPDELPEDAAGLPPAPVEARPTTMQKTVPPDQVDFYLDRGYDRVAGFVHRAAEVEHLRAPGDLFAALGLVHDESPYQADAKEAFVLRWPAHRPSLYRIPYGGQNEPALRAMDGWVIERAPFRGNGFAPGEGKDVIAEFKVDSVRLPHGAQLWRLDADGGEQLMAFFDGDAPGWQRVGQQDA